MAALSTIGQAASLEKLFNNLTMQSVWALDNDTVIKDFISELSDQIDT